MKTWRDSIPEPEGDFFRIEDGEKKEITFKDEGTQIKDFFGNDAVKFQIECDGKTQNWDIALKNPLSRVIRDFKEPLEGRKFLISRKGVGQKDTRYKITEILE